MRLSYTSLLASMLVHEHFAAASPSQNDTNITIQQLASSNLTLSPAQIVAIADSPTISTNPAPLLNLTAPIIQNSSNDIDVECGYGTSLIYDSCVDAFNTFKESRTTYLTIGKRPPNDPSTTTRTQYDYQLPIRWISGTSYVFSLHQ